MAEVFTAGVLNDIIKVRCSLGTGKHEVFEKVDIACLLFILILGPYIVAYTNRSHRGMDILVVKDTESVGQFVSDIVDHGREFTA